MKKIAFFVEGQTEQLFINKLLIEIAGQKNIAIELKTFGGKNNPPTSNLYPKTIANPQNTTKHFALIYDCRGDESLKSRILEEHQDLIQDGYQEIIGIRDLFPLTDLLKLEDRLLNGLVKNGNRVELALPQNCHIIVVVNEIEAIFLAECTHFENIDNRLTRDLITTSMSIDPCVDDVTLLIQPSITLKDIYQLVNKTYKKDKKVVEKTVECLDYANIYINQRSRIVKLDELITKIDTFLT
jgi:hypothetical protein